MQLSALDVAKRVINYSLTPGIDTPLTNIELQRILYMLNIFYLFATDECLIKDEIVSDALGPYYREPFLEFESYGSNPIEDLQEIDEFPVLAIETDRIYGYIDFLLFLSDEKLEEKIRELDGPWDRSRDDRLNYVPVKYLEEYVYFIRDATKDMLGLEELEKAYEASKILASLPEVSDLTRYIKILKIVNTYGHLDPEIADKIKDNLFLFLKNLG